ncbi:MAG: AtzE family amidohydrolase [Pseudomonadota bacterium]
MTHNFASMVEVAEAVRSGKITAVESVERALKQIDGGDAKLNCFMQVDGRHALEAAETIDKAVSEGRDPGPLAGVPFAVKDLFDLNGQITKGGSRLREDAAPADADALAVERLKAAGAVCLGRLNMDEFAYGFATVNTHYGTTRNPHDPERLAGGSSGGSASAVAAGFVPLTLGSDTNGSVRVPASLCGLFGLRPSFDGLPIEGVFPFVERLDTIGPFTRTLEDMEVAYAVLAGAPPKEAPSTEVNVARLDGWFRSNCDPEGLVGVDAIGAALGDAPLVELSLAEAVRSAAFLITAKDGGQLHLPDLKTHAMAYDPLVRDRLIAGAILADEVVKAAEEMIERFKFELGQLLETYDVLIAPSTPTAAPKISDGLIEMNGKMVSARANLGLYTQPLSVAGVPILSVPLNRPGKLPLGVQLIGRVGEDARLFEVARHLVEAGLVAFTAPETLEVSA